MVALCTAPRGTMEAHKPHDGTGTMRKNRNKPTNHIIEADGFHRVMFDIRASASPVLAGSLSDVIDAVRPAYGEGNVVARASGDVNTMAAEVFARLYEGDNATRTEDKAGAAWEQKAHGVLDNSDSFRSLCASVAGDVDFSALALCGVLGDIAGNIGELINTFEEDAKQGEPGSPGGIPGDGEGKTSKDMWGITPEDAMEAALSVACEEIKANLEDTKNAMAGLAPGLGGAPGPKGQQDPRRMLLAEKLRDDDELRDVLKKAGRLHRMHTKARKTKTDGHTEIVDVERGGDLARILPSVLIGLMDADLEDHTMIEIMEKKALQYALAGTAPLGRGPIVLMRDVSGSMDGNPHSWAAAVGILCTQVANKEHRQLTIVNYASYVRRAYRLDTRGNASTWADGYWNEIGGMADMILEVASDAIWGGTRMGPAMDWVFENTDLMKSRADLVIVTDGRSDNVSENTLEKITSCKEQGLRVSGLTINGGSLYRSLSEVCDSVVSLDRSGDTARQAANGILV